MNTREADALGENVAVQVQAGRPQEAYDQLAPVLAQRTPFRLLDRIGEALGTATWEAVDPFLDLIAAAGTEGGWVVIASALGRKLDADLAGALARCRTYVVAAGVWYGADILAERVPGPALLAHFEPALELLAPWRADPNRWVRRTTGVAAHFWAKRSRGVPKLAPQAAALLAFLDPMFEEQEVDAVKGVGWGLKTLGQVYPDLVAAWLEEQVQARQRRPRALMLRKAMTYLPDEARRRLFPE
jgi:hypothetical protein